MKSTCCDTTQGSFVVGLLGTSTKDDVKQRKRRVILQYSLIHD